MLRWSAGQLITWRWASLVLVCRGLLEREEALRGAWNLRAFLRSSGDGEIADEEQDVGNRDDVRKRPKHDAGQIWTQFDAAITSAWFWCYVRFLCLVDGQINHISTWMEGCSCHGWAAKHCPLKGRRCAELASGEFSKFLQESLEKTRSAFITCASKLSSEQARADLHTDFRVAIDTLMAEAVLKTSHWAQLPWSLCALASSDQQKATEAARHCMKLFDTSLAGLDNEQREFVLSQHHPLTKRFLHRDFHDDGASAGAEDVSCFIFCGFTNVGSQTCKPCLVFCVRSSTPRKTLINCTDCRGLRQWETSTTGQFAARSRASCFRRKPFSTSRALFLDWRSAASAVRGTRHRGEVYRIQQHAARVFT